MILYGGSSRGSDTRAPEAGRDEHPVPPTQLMRQKCISRPRAGRAEASSAGSGAQEFGSATSVGAGDPVRVGASCAGHRRRAKLPRPIGLRLTPTQVGKRAHAPDASQRKNAYLNKLIESCVSSPSLLVVNIDHVASRQAQKAAERPTTGDGTSDDEPAPTDDRRPTDDQQTIDG